LALKRQWLVGLIIGFGLDWKPHGLAMIILNTLLK